MAYSRTPKSASSTSRRGDRSSPTRLLIEREPPGTARFCAPRSLKKRCRKEMCTGSISPSSPCSQLHSWIDLVFERKSGGTVRNE